MQAPVIILHTPQMGENIGAAARVMANFGLEELRLVAPRDGWPNERAVAMASGADWIIEGARVFATLEEAMADIQFALATTARPRDMEKEVIGPREAAAQIASLSAGGVRCAVLFGGEAKGLPNDAIVAADAILSYPVSARHASLNLGQAVGVFAYAWASRVEDGPSGRHGEGFEGLTPPAERAVLEHFIAYLEEELERGGFFFPPDKAPVMKQNIRTALVRARMTDQEVRTFYGIVKALTIGRGPAWAHNRSARSEPTD